MKAKSLRRGWIPAVCWVAVGLATGVVTVASASPSCPAAVADRAEQAVYDAHNWRQFHAFYALYGTCDTNWGSLGEATSDKVETLLASHWEQFGQLAQISKSDPGFEKYVLDQLGEIMSLDGTRRIRRLAKRSCPPTAKALCLKVVARLADTAKVR